jgi:murein DD-endopeptidase MepM/ murein hydrolase activator NlpD
MSMRYTFPFHRRLPRLASSAALILACAVGALVLPVLAWGANNTALKKSERPPPIQWGNAVYVDLAVGESYHYKDRTVTLLAIEGNSAWIDVEGTRESLVVARRELPKVVAGVRIFLADNRVVATLTTDSAFPRTHGLTTRDALLCLSDASQPLLDPARFTFPISRSDGYEWSMEENGHMFAYMGQFRSHEGMDFNLHDARGLERHALCAIESGTVRWVETKLAKKNEACVLLESDAQPGLYYIYQHLNRAKVHVTSGQKVARGQSIGYIWGDNRWGHFHFAVVARSDAPPVFTHRYENVLNAFPALFELWHGTLEAPARTWREGEFEFARHRWLNGNRQRISSYDNVVGYGWRLGAWCAAGKVEFSSHADKTMPGGVALLRKTMHTDTPYPAKNPLDYFDFEVAVENGTYAVGAVFGSRDDRTWQRVTFEQTEAGVFALEAGESARTPRKQVTVADGRLTMRVFLKDAETAAGVNTFSFKRVQR